MWLVAGVILIVLLLLVGGAFLQGRWHKQPDAWEIIQERGFMRVGMDASYPPFEWIDENGTFQGYDVALAQALAERWGVRVEWVNIHFDGLYDALSVGRIDMIVSALPYDRTLTRDVIYSRPYFNAGQVLVVPKESSIATIQDLDGAVVAVELGTEAHHLARMLVRDRNLALEILTARELAEAATAVVEGRAAALLCDRVEALGLLREHPLRIVEPPLTNEPYVIAVRADSPRLAREIDMALGAWLEDGTLEVLAQSFLY